MGFRDQPEQKPWLNEVLDTTARILGYPSIMKLPPEQIEQKKAEVSQLLHNYRTLYAIRGSMVMQIVLSTRDGIL